MYIHVYICIYIYIYIAYIHMHTYIQTQNFAGAGREMQLGSFYVKDMIEQLDDANGTQPIVSACMCMYVYVHMYDV